MNNDFSAYSGIFPELIIISHDCCIDQLLSTGVFFFYLYFSHQEFHGEYTLLCATPHQIIRPTPLVQFSSTLSIEAVLPKVEKC